MKLVITLAAALLAGSALPPQDAVQDQGSTGPLHAANVGKLVFTRTDLALSAIGASSFADSFSLGDPIYFRAYMAKSGVNAIAPMMRGAASGYSHRVRYRLVFRVDGKPPIETAIRPWGLPEEHRNWTTWRGQLLDRTDSKVPGWDAFREFLSRAMAKGQLNPGSHRIEVELLPLVVMGEEAPTVGPVVAKGGFTLNVGAGAVKASDAKTCMPAGAMRDAGAEAAIVARARATWNEAATRPEQASITHTGWTFHHHPISGRVVRRSIDARIVARGAEYCTFRGYNYSQTAIGSGFESQGDFQGAEEYATYLPCACLGR